MYDAKTRTLMVEDELSLQSEDLKEYSDKVEHLTLGEKVKTVPIDCFINWTKLRTVEFLGVETLGAASFAYCESLEKVWFGPNSSLKSIDSQAFMGTTSLKSINLPDSLDTLDSEAFMESGLQSINCTVRHLGFDVFTQSSLEEARIVVTEPIGYSECSLDRTFSDCRKLKTVFLDAELEAEFESVFEFSTVESVTLGERVNFIGTDWFKDCTELKSLVIEGDLVSVELNAFHNCIKFDAAKFQGILLSSEEFLSLVKGFENDKAKTLGEYLRFCKVEEFTVKEGLVDLEGLEETSLF